MLNAVANGNQQQILAKAEFIDLSVRVRQMEFT